MLFRSQREHVLSRPDMYIGSVEVETDKIWVVDGDGSDEAPHKLNCRDITYSPALYKIFDEIIVNAADNKQRDPSMSELRVVIDKESGTISVYNNGQGIPVVVHKEHQMYVPELIFGHMMTSSNYDDTQKRTVGGRNGYGAKLTNIYSTQFVVETLDSSRGLRYKQVFSNNMQDKTEPKIGPATGASWTKITFKPDFPRFGATGLDADCVALFTKRVFDVTGTAPKGLKVYLNNERVKIGGFKDYLDMYLATAPAPSGPSALLGMSSGDGGEAAANKCVYEKLGERWEVGVAASPDSHFQQVSFVNSICTLKGGTHVAAVTDQIIKAIIEQIGKKHKKLTIKPQHVKNHLWVFCNALIDNPTFDTQTKVTLTSKRSAFGSDPTLSESFIKKVLKSAVIDAVLAFSQISADKELKKNDGKKAGRITGIAKLEDANLAGGRFASECTLVLTEGDSAKALAMAGLTVIGRDRYGVFPLRGKVLNVRDAAHKQIMENAEISMLKQILGLQQGKVYTDTKSLRYGHIMIMTDQDHDGSHIKGLLINLFAAFWPSLLKMPGFLTEFITPIVKVSKGAREVPFYTLPEYESWRETNGNGVVPKGWKVKYYKGLGTSTSAEAKVYFANIDSHQIPFAFKSDECTKLIEMAFSKTAADARKEWMARFEPGTFLDHAVSRIYYEDFINRELILFSIASNQRAIPSLVDGLKPGQRKVLFACFKRNLVNEIKVAQLSGYVAENSAYHHGEVSLSGTIVNLAQNYVGSNNINFLWPSGQFGTRAQGGRDSASPRYIFTYLSPITRTVFSASDDAILNYLNDDGQSIEPEWYVPVVPTVLINGSSGIGTGWSSDIPNYNPREIVANLRRMLSGEEPKEMHPYYKGFIGQMVAKGRRGNYSVRGLVEVVDGEQDTVYISELPVGKWTAEVKQYLEEQITAGAVKDFKEYHKDNTVAFVVELTPAAMVKALETGLEKYFRLESSLSTTNMVLFDRRGGLKRYDTPVEIMKEFYGIRLEYYDKRKQYLVSKLTSELERLDNRVRFILAVIKDELKIRNVKRAVIRKQMLDMGFKPLPKSDKAAVLAAAGKKDAAVAAEAEEAAGADAGEDDDENAADGGAGDSASAAAMGGFDYLLSMPLWALTYEKVEALLREKASKSDELAELARTPPATLWMRDLDAFSAALDAHEAREDKELQAADNAHYSRSGRGGNTKTKTAPKKTYDNEDDDDDDEESEDAYDFDGDDSEDDWGKPAKKKKAAAKKPAKGGKATASGKEPRNIPKFVLRARPKEQTNLFEEEKETGPKRVTKKVAERTAADEAMIAMLMSDDPTADADALSTAISQSVAGVAEAADAKAKAKAEAKKPRAPRAPKDKDDSKNKKSAAGKGGKSTKNSDKWDSGAEDESSDGFIVTDSDDDGSGSDFGGDVDDSFFDNDSAIKAKAKVPAKPKAVAKPTAAKKSSGAGAGKKAKKAGSDSEDDFDASSGDEYVPVASARAPRAAATAAKARARVMADNSDDDDDDDDDSGSDSGDVVIDDDDDDDDVYSFGKSKPKDKPKAAPTKEKKPAAPAASAKSKSKLAKNNRVLGDDDDDNSDDAGNGNDDDFDDPIAKKPAAAKPVELDEDALQAMPLMERLAAMAAAAAAKKDAAAAPVTGGAKRVGSGKTEVSSEAKKPRVAKPKADKGDAKPAAAAKAKPAAKADKAEPKNGGGKKARALSNSEDDYGGGDSEDD